MQPYIQKSTSDDEDDLESLRLAALQSLKRPSNSNAGNPSNSLRLFNKKSNQRRFNASRANRNGSFNNRIRSTTLITVPTIESDATTKDVTKADVAPPKLVLPQDRYCNTTASAEEKSEASSKFDRYNDSDSDSDSDSNDENSVPSKLERSDSLEALMQELENEIQGEAKPKEETPPKPKKPKKVRKVKEVLDPPQLPPPKTIEVKHEEHVKVLVKLPQKQLHNNRRVENCIPQSMPIYANSAQVPFQAMPYTNYNVPACPPVPFEAQIPYNYPVVPPLICVNEINPPLQPVFTKYDNPLPPLNINTDILNTISAPLSPRSAAFVLQNREIIERRKKSPRRSYSRSPSPRYRRTNSRSVSPVRRLSPKNRRAQPYKRSSPGSLVRYGQASPKRTRKSPPRPARPIPEEVVKTTDNSPSISLSPSPDRCIVEGNSDDVIDPVLEARRKKFETGAVPTEGIIRLRPKSGENENVVSSTKDEFTESQIHSSDEEVHEDQLLGADDAIDFNVKMDDLFSDEESDSENEGRFKSKQNSPRVVPVKPFTQITNGISETTAVEADRGKSRSKPHDREKRYERERRENRRSSRSPPSVNKDVVKPSRNEKEHDGIKSLMSLKIENPRKKTSSPAREPKSVKHTVEDSNVKDKKTVRKVEITNVQDCTIKEDSDPDEELANINGSGDLRAQLSRKRAERQHMQPKPEKISSRLLQNALQGAVFKKTKKSKKKDDVISVDGKLPIHLRLGVPSSFNIANESKVKKKSSGKRSKSRAKYEQV